MHHVAVPADNGIGAEFFRGVQRLDPVIRITVAHKRSPAVQRIASAQHFLLAQEDENVTVGMRSAEPQNLYRAPIT